MSKINDCEESEANKILLDSVVGSFTKGLEIGEEKGRKNWQLNSVHDGELLSSISKLIEKNEYDKVSLMFYMLHLRNATE